MGYLFFTWKTIAEAIGAGSWTSRSDCSRSCGCKVRSLSAKGSQTHLSLPRAWSYFLHQKTTALLPLVSRALQTLLFLWAPEEAQSILSLTTEAFSGVQGEKRTGTASGRHRWAGHGLAGAARVPVGTRPSACMRWGWCISRLEDATVTDILGANLKLFQSVKKE